MFTLSTSFNEKNEQDDKQAQRSVHLESQSNLIIVLIVDSSHKPLNSATDLEVAEVLLLNDIAHDLHLDGLDRPMKSLESR